ncbi:uncharacterized protein LOC115813708 isoform X2 [Chanos chanos]|nr:uncharacterized protein LOC115813708 isoform X2 [Chanos chanos]
MRVQDVHALHVKGQVRGQFQRITDGKSVNIYKPLVSMSFSGDCFLIGKSISEDILPFISSLINSSLSTGVVPSALKGARVKPLLKKPTLNPAGVRSYRPVSLLPFLSKTLECAVYNQLSPYLLRNNHLDPNQSGFKASRSTEITLLAVIEELHLAKAKSLSSVLILLDLSTAFNTVNHQILLSALLGWALQDPHSHGSNPTSLNVPTRSLEGIGLLPPPFPDGGPTRFCTLPPKSNHVLQPV